MNIELLEYICQIQSTLSSISIRLYLNQTHYKAFDTNTIMCNLDLSLPYLDLLFTSNAQVSYYISQDLLISGIIKVKDTPYTLILGPLRLGSISEATARKLLISRIYPLKLDQLPHFFEYLTSLPNITVGYFINLLSLINSNINHDIIQSEEIIRHSICENIEAEINHHVIEAEEQTSFHGISRRNPHHFEAELLFYIKHGMTTQLKHLSSKGLADTTGALAYDTLRDRKSVV